MTKEYINADQALELLKQGNAEFVETAAHDGELKTHIIHDDMALHQKPFAVILGCSDSRAPAELVFNQGFGALFIVRVAGNIVAPSQVGSIEFACQQFGTELVVVMGHTSCGAVTATVDSLLGCPDALSPNLAAIVDRVKPSIEPLIEAGKEPDREQLLSLASPANIAQSVKNLQSRSEIIRGLVEQGRLKIVGAQYHIDDGRVEFL